MPKRAIKKWMPDPSKFKDHKSLAFLGDILHEPNLWHINRHGVARAFLVGLFFAMLPVPFQMVLAALVAVWINCNLPISVALCWITNPLTMPPIFYFNYWIGAKLMGKPPQDFDFELSLAWLSSKLVEIGIPLYFGSLVMAVFLGAGSYFLIQWLWRRKVRHDWRVRVEARIKRRQTG